MSNNFLVACSGQSCSSSALQATKVHTAFSWRMLVHILAPRQGAARVLLAVAATATRVTLHVAVVTMMVETIQSRVHVWVCSGCRLIPPSVTSSASSVSTVRSRPCNSSMTDTVVDRVASGSSTSRLRRKLCGLFFC
ncbi:hypothetical protein Tcan_02407 [Toxocara canis]|uniref:Uncharacterized protein n=1 Tax=Toxocara canis TaxID=6265 RepID=A0A0B2UQ76_TOXCA|nr:hypothetical protein Tcan_02407 [Toxocara canis]